MPPWDCNVCPELPLARRVGAPDAPPYKISPAVVMGLAILAVICVWMADVTPDRCPNSAAVTAETATLPEPSLTNALLKVKLLVVMVVAAPVMVACLPPSWVWMAEVTPERYPNSAAVRPVSALL